MDATEKDVFLRAKPLDVLPTAAPPTQRELELRSQAKTMLSSLASRDQEDLRYAILAILEAEPSLIPVLEGLIGGMVLTQENEIESIAISTEEAQEAGKRIAAVFALLKGEEPTPELTQIRGAGSREGKGEGAEGHEASPVSATESAFRVLDEEIERAEAHCAVSDWTSTLSLLRSIIANCRFDAPGAHTVASDERCQVFLHRMRVLWQETLGSATTLEPQMRVDVVQEVVSWDPQVEYRLPDEWDILFNECRDTYFASNPVEFALMEILELWEKLRTYSVAFAVPDENDESPVAMSSSEILELSSVNIAIVMSEAQRFTANEAAADRIRKHLAASLVVNCRIRKVFNKIQLLLEHLERQTGEGQAELVGACRTPQSISGSSHAWDFVKNVMDQDPESRLGKSQPLRGIYFWHHMRLKGLTARAEAVEILANEIHGFSLEVHGSFLAAEYRRHCRAQPKSKQEDSLSEAAVRCENQLSSLAARVTAKHSAARDMGDHSTAVLLGVLESSMCMQQAVNQAYHAVAKAGRYEFLDVFSEGPGGLEVISGAPAAGPPTSPAATSPARWR